ncbi:hypothetical protein [Alkaliphilus flagellatus]|nr:hypothetical protein [Alkaliphilus flagellatus]
MKHKRTNKTPYIPANEATIGFGLAHVVIGAIDMTENRNDMW